MSVIQKDVYTQYCGYIPKGYVQCGYNAKLRLYTQYCRYTGVRCNVFNIETYIAIWRYQKMEKLHLPIIIEMDEDGYYIVSCPLFRGCHSYGETIDEALENIEEVIEMCLEETKIEELNKFVGFRELELAQNA